MENRLYRKLWLLLFAFTAWTFFAQTNEEISKVFPNKELVRIISYNIMVWV